MKWRTVFTDSESEKGVTPVCTDERHPWVVAGAYPPDSETSAPDGVEVFDCCRGPVLGCESVSAARVIANMLTVLAVGIAD